MKSTTYNVVSTRLDNLFSIFGYPDEITTDNGPPWDGNEIDIFFKSRGIKHTPSIPYWPRSNGPAERFMPNLSKLIRHSYDANTVWKDTLRSMLLNYRNCIHPATNEKPSTLFFNREINTGLPIIQPQMSPKYDAVKQHHDIYTQKAKQTADRKCQNIKQQINTGDQVYVKRGKRDHKFQTTYMSDEFTMTEVTGTQITLKNNRTQQTFKRHVSFVKLIQKRNDNNHQQNKDIPDVIKTPTTKKQYPLRSRK